MLLSVLGVLVALSPIVIIHEFGHFIACRLTGIGVKEFSFGFGKILWHRKSAKGTDFQIRAIPFGGFVEPEGQMFLDEDDPAPQPQEFAAKKWYAKFFMVVNGAVFNYVLAALIFSVLIYWRGMPEHNPVKLAPIIGEVVEGYPGKTVGLLVQDQITAVNGQPIAHWKALTQAIADRQGDLNLTILRNGETLNILVKDSDFQPDKPTVLGIAVQSKLEPVGFWEAAWLGIYQCYYWTKYSLTSLGQSFTRKKAPDLAGPIGIVNIIHKSVHTGLENFIFLIAMLSLAVGLFNLFPIPILDGGYALVFLGEGITGKLPSMKVLTRAANVGLYILILLVLYASYSDIKRIFFAPKPAAQTQEVTQEGK